MRSLIPYSGRTQIGKGNTTTIWEWKRSRRRDESVILRARHEPRRKGNLDSDMTRTVNTFASTEEQYPFWWAVLWKTGIFWKCPILARHVVSFPRLSGTKISLYLSWEIYTQEHGLCYCLEFKAFGSRRPRKERPKAKKRRRLRRMKKLITRLWELRSIFAWEAPEGAKPRFGGMRGRRSASEMKQEAREEPAEAERRSEQKANWFTNKNIGKLSSSGWFLWVSLPSSLFFHCFFASDERTVWGVKKRNNFFAFSRFLSPALHLPQKNLQ